MPSMKSTSEVVTLVLGAGASRGVKYAPKMEIPSPLDKDFFDLLQRVPLKGMKTSFRADTEKAIKAVVDSALERPEDALWESMEKMFYTLHLSAVMKNQLFDWNYANDPAKKTFKNFAYAMLALLRVAHGTQICSHHKRLFKLLGGEDAVITFNYDLVSERALKAAHPGVGLGDWVYAGLDTKTSPVSDMPRLHKLHGSVSWVSDEVGNEEEELKVKPRFWRKLDVLPGYTLRGGPNFPILLPYWDKHVEKKPWLPIWTEAARQLEKTTTLIVWGYSLPLTDPKARELFRLASVKPDLKKVCVIDPSDETYQRWRRMFLHQHFWRFQDIQDFFRFRKSPAAVALAF